MRRRRITATPALAALIAPLIAALSSIAGAPAAAAASSALPGPVVLIGTGGLRWDDAADSTPALFSLLDFGAVGTLAVRSVRPTTCPVDGWLGVSAGRRAADAALPHGAACRKPEIDLPTPGGPATVPRWSVYQHQAARDPYQASPGLLGRALAAGSVETAAVGAPKPTAELTAGTENYTGKIEAGGQTIVAYSIDSTLAGKLGSIGQPVLKAKAKELEKKFTERLRAAFAAGETQ